MWLLSFRRGRKFVVFRLISVSARNLLLHMAAPNNDSNKENMVDDQAEQIVTMEKVEAADNKGIDYDKLISELELLSTRIRTNLE